MPDLLEERNILIGENLRKYRLLKGLTQDELADGICSVSQLSKVENGKTHLNRSLLKQMASRLGVTVERIETEDALLGELSETLQLAKDAVSVQKYEKAYELAELVVQRSIDFQYAWLLAEATLVKCRTMRKLHQFAEAIQILKSGLENSLPQDANQRMMFLFDLGHTYESIGNKRAAFDAFLRADDELEHVDDNLDIRMLIYLNLGRSHFLINNYRSSLRYFERAEQLAMRLSKHLSRIRSGYMKATTLRHLGESDKAEALFRSFLKEAEDNNFLLDVAIINNNMGSLFQERKQYGQALVHFKRALQVHEIINEESYVCSTLVHLAELFYEMGEWEAAIQETERVIVLAERVQVNTYLDKGKAFTLLGWVYKAQGKEDAYIKWLEEALRVYDQSQALLEAYQVAKELAEYFYSQHDNRAMEMYKKAVEYNEGSQNINKWR